MSNNQREVSKSPEQTSKNYNSLQLQVLHLLWDDIQQKTEYLENRDCFHLHIIFRFPEIVWTRWWVQKPNKWETAAARPLRLTLWNKTIHFLFCAAREELLAAALFGQASTEPGHGEGCQRQRNTRKHAREQVSRHAYSHIHVHSGSLCTMIACPLWQWHWEAVTEHLDTSAKGNYAWKCPI